MQQNLLDKVYLDDVLAKFDIRGRYHAVTAVWLAMGLTFETMWFCNYVLIAEEINYRCVTFNNTSEIFFSCNDQNYRNTTAARCKDPVPCTHWVYENPNSFVAEFQLACQDWKRTLVGTVSVFGYMIGIIFVGSLSDSNHDARRVSVVHITSSCRALGRKTMTIVTGTAGALCGFAKSFAGYYWIYVAFEFLEAFIGDPFSPVFVLGLEMVATDYRATYMSIVSMGIVIGGTLFPLIKWLLPYWRTCLRVIYAPGLVFLFLIYLLDESPRWLLTKGKTDIVVKNIKKAAKLNKIEIEDNLSMLSCEGDMSADFKTVIRETFKSRLLLRRFFVCVVWWIVGVFVGHGLTVNSVLMGGNKNLNFALAFLMRLPSSILAAYVMNIFNRRGPLLISFVACGLICVGHPFIPKSMLWLVITVYMTSRLITGMGYTITYVFTSELFPTYTRNSMQALCSSIGRIGGMVATQMPLLVAYWPGLPIVLYGVTSLVAAIVTLLVPDTTEISLPDTIQQAEAIDADDHRETARPTIQGPIVLTNKLHIENTNLD
ncbi:solute carrier family 22 member 2-like [Choristoneura fumiferana]|uniref:solute carrier family 22 member 2-like n=1 Tax=Choristoneura fumiferana TaxID=7141 RepID=UPI003D15BB8F